MTYLKQISRHLSSLLNLSICLCLVQIANAQSFQELTPIADDEGFAAPYVGVSNGSLIVAGGANFPDKPRWETDKVWYDSIFILDEPDGQWRVSPSKLPRPLAYGLSFNLSEDDPVLAKDVPRGVLCIGGGDSQQHIKDCFVLTLKKKRVIVSDLPPLPAPLAYSTGVLHQGVIYLFGGLQAPSATRPAKVFWKLDLTTTENKRRWEKLQPWPGAPRMLAVSGAMDQSLFLFSGTDLFLTEDGSVGRRYLQDGYSYDLVTGKWKQTAPLPRPAVAAPTPAITTKDALWIVSGDHGELASQTNTLKDNHPGFPSSVLAFHPAENRWSNVNEFPKSVGDDPAGSPHAGIWPPVVTNVTTWKGIPVIACGEVRPRVRSRRIFMVHPSSPR